MTTRRAVFFSLGIYPGGRTRTAVEVRAQQNLAALHDLGYELTIICPRDEHGRGGLDMPVEWVDPLPSTDLAGFFRERAYQHKVRQILAKHLRDPKTLLFCEHIQALACSPRHPTLVYSCLDLIYQIVRLRRQMSQNRVTLKTRLYWRYLEWLETRLWRKAQAIICVSATEAVKIETRTGIPSEYLPIVPAKATVPLVRKTFSGPARFWLYGTSAATANKIILNHLAGGLFEQIRAACPTAEFHQLGSFATYAPDKIEWLQRHFTMHGFVEDPTTVFQQGDFCLIPYEYDTGFRTKLPELCGYGMIPVGYPATFACCPEMQNGVNCLIGENATDLVAKLALASCDSAQRQRLAEGAIATCYNEFANTTLLEKYRKILSTVG